MNEGRKEVGERPDTRETKKKEEVRELQREGLHYSIMKVTFPNLRSKGKVCGWRDTAPSFNGEKKSEREGIVLF